MISMNVILLEYPVHKPCSGEQNEHMIFIENILWGPVVLWPYDIEGRQGKVCFLLLLLSDQICKIIRPLFRKKARRRRKIFEVPFFKKLAFLGKFNGF